MPTVMEAVLLTQLWDWESVSRSDNAWVKGSPCSTGLFAELGGFGSQSRSKPPLRGAGESEPSNEKQCLG